MSSCPTVRITSSVDGIEYFVINESDFDPARHTIFVNGGSAKSGDAFPPCAEMRLVDIKAALKALSIPIPNNASKEVCWKLLYSAKQTDHS